MRCNVENDRCSVMFLERGMKGEASYLSKRYSKSDDNTEILYWDANN